MRCVITLGGVDEPVVLPELANFGAVMTLQEVAEVLRLNEEVAMRLMRSHKLPGFKVGGQWRARRADIQAVMTGTWQPPAGASGSSGQHED